MDSVDTLFGILPAELPRSTRLFVVAMIIFHILAVIVWAIYVSREVAGGKYRRPKVVHAE